MTQNQFVDFLNKKSLFINLSEAVTISRWESDTVIPSFKKLMNILQALDKENLFTVIDSLHHKGFFDAPLHSFDRSLERINYFRNHPYIRDERLHFSSELPDTQRLQLLSSIKGYDDSLSELIFNRLLKEKDWQDKCVYRECTSLGELGGHILVVTVRKDVLQSLIHSGQQDSSALENLFNINNDDETTLCILSFYAGSNKVFTLLLGHVIKHFYANKSATQFGVFCHNESLSRTFSALKFSIGHKINYTKNHLKLVTKHCRETFMYKNKGELMQDRLAICTVIRSMNPLFSTK